MTFQDQSQLTPQEPSAQDASDALNQLAANVLLTVQAFQQLHKALDDKFTRSPSHET